MSLFVRRGLSTLYTKDIFQSLYQPALKEQIYRIYPSHKVHFNDGLKLGMAKHDTKFNFSFFIIPCTILGFVAAYCCHGDSRKKWRYSIFHDSAVKKNEKPFVEDKMIEDEVVIMFDGVMENEYILPWWDLVKVPRNIQFDKTFEDIDKVIQENIETFIDDEIRVDVYTAQDRKQPTNASVFNEKDALRSLEEFEENPNK